MADYSDPKRATAYRFTLSLYARSDNQIKVTPTLAAGDVKVSKDNGATANITTLPAETPASSGILQVDLSATEMTADLVTIIFRDAAGAEWNDVAVNIAPSPVQMGDLATAANLTVIDDLIDTEVAAIKTVVDAILVDTAEIGAAGAGLTALATQASVNTVDDFLDTEIAAIKAKTDLIPAAPAAVGDIPTAAAVADAVWDEVLSGHLTAGTTGNALNSAGSAGDPWGTALPGAYGAGSAGYILGTNLDTTVSSRASQTSVNTVDDFLDTEMAAVLASVDTEVAAIKAKTDSLTFTVAGQVDANTLRVGGTLQTAGDIMADTNDIQARLPAALVSGRMDVSVGAMAANVMTAAAAAADLTTELQSGLATSAALTTVAGYIDTEVASILAAVDTEVAAIKAKTDNLPSDPADASDIASSFSTVNSTLSTIAGYIDTEVSTIVTQTSAASIRTAVGLASANLDTQIGTLATYLDTEIAAILADTNELQTDWANGGRLDLLIDAINAKTTNLPSDPADASVIAGRFDTLDTSVADLPTNAELATALAAADDAVLAAIAALNNLSAAQVNAEVVDALATDTYAEPGQGTPGATISLAAKVNYIYKALRNKSTVTATEHSIFNDDAVTVDHKRTISDDATTFTSGELTTGP